MRVATLGTLDLEAGLSCTAQSWDSVPLCKALHERTLQRSEAGEAQVSLHIPGHKRGGRVHPALRRLLGQEALSHDLTELKGGAPDSRHLRPY